MNVCPDKEILERLLEGELDDAAMNDVMEHLSQCEGCRETVDQLITEDERFMLALLRTRGPSGKNAPPNEGRDCLSPLLILAYITDALSVEQLSRVESHLETCDRCMEQMKKLQTLHMMQGEPDLDLSFLDEPEEGYEALQAKVLSIVLRARQGALELIRQTGQMLSPASVAYSVRGQGAGEEELEMFMFRKDLKDRDMSVEVAIRRILSGGSISARVSVMVLSTEEFARGMELVLSGNGRDDVQKTDEFGIVVFRDIKMGHYLIRDKNGDIVSIVIE